MSNPTKATPHAVCAICQCPVAPAEAVTECPACHARYHLDCWQENRGCAVYGCPEVPPTELHDTLEVPVSYWGQEDKPCPVCGQVILAVAVRCRHCGATFQSAQPETAAEFRRRGELKSQEAMLRTVSIWIFVLSLIPCLAPLVAVVGGFWCLFHRQQIRQLSGVYRSLCPLGVTLAVAQVVMVIVFTYLYSHVGM